MPEGEIAMVALRIRSRSSSTPTPFWPRKYRNLTHRPLLRALSRARLRPVPNLTRKAGPAGRIPTSPAGYYISECRSNIAQGAYPSQNGCDLLLHLLNKI